MKLLICGIGLMVMVIDLSSCMSAQRVAAGAAIARMKPNDFFKEPLDQKLVDAVARGNGDMIAQLIRQGADVNAVGHDGMRPLFWAIGKNNVKGFRVLLLNGADPNVTAYDSNSADRSLSLMGLAAIAAEPAYLELALKHGGNPDGMVGYGNRTIIFESILNHRPENVHVLIDAGADINHLDSSGSTPIQAAADVNDFEIVYFLLKAGADLKIKNRWGNDLAALLGLFGARGIERNSEQYKYYLKVLSEMENRGLMENGGGESKK